MSNGYGYILHTMLILCLQDVIGLYGNMYKGIKSTIVIKKNSDPKIEVSIQKLCVLLLYNYYTIVYKLYLYN